MLINLQETVANFSSYDTKDHILEKAKKKKIWEILLYEDFQRDGGFIRKKRTERRSKH